MNESVESLYERAEYPGMSHPVAHPSAIAASALLAGLRTPALETARILEIGCSQGHHILPIAQMWPRARVTAIDVSASAVEVAKRVAAAAGITNVELICADVRHWHAAAESYDYVIAHGVFSWVDDECKSALLRLCRDVLSTSGVAMVSYNTLPGWLFRQSLAQMTRALQQKSLCDGSAMAALGCFERALHERQDDYGRYLHSVVSDTAKKGQQTLAFDDLAPINDPCYFSQFFHWVSQAGLRYLGESDMGVANGETFTQDALALLPKLGADPLLQQQTMDFLSGRCFRTSLICRNDAELSAPTTEEMEGLAVEMLQQIVPCGHSVQDAIAAALCAFSPGSVSVQRLTESVAGVDAKSFHAAITRLAALGMIRFVSHESLAPQEIPQRPTLSLLNRIYLRENRTVIDALHKPCLLSEADCSFLTHCDGTCSYDELLQGQASPNVERIKALMQHISERGVFANG